MNAKPHRLGDPVQASDSKQANARNPQLFAALAMVCAAASLFGFNAAFIVGSASACGVIGFAIVAATDHRKSRWAAAAASCVALMALSYHSYRHQVAQLESRFAPAIAAVEQYRRENGNYPDADRYGRIDADIELPECRSGDRAHYHRSGRGGAEVFSITCVTFAFNKHSYDSDRGEWDAWD